MKTITYWLVTGSVIACTQASVAFAQHTHNSDLLRLEAHGTLSTYEGIGGGLRAEFVILPEGAIPNFDDDISLTAGADAIIFFDDHDHDHPGHDDDHDDDGLGIWPAGAVQWNFYLGRDWSVFPELGIWLQLGEDGHGHDDDDIDMDLLLGVGARYHLGGRSAILIRLEYPGLLHIGAQF